MSVELVDLDDSETEYTLVQAGPVYLLGQQSHELGVGPYLVFDALEVDL